jgi:hypothetical protein
MPFVALSPQAPAFGCGLAAYPENSRSWEHTLLACPGIVPAHPSSEGIHLYIISHDVHKCTYLPEPAPTSTLLEHTKATSDVEKCEGGASIPVLPRPSRIAHQKNNRRNVIKCNHFPAQLPASTLKTACPSPLRPARHSANVTQNSPKPRRPPSNPPTHAHMSSSFRGRYRPPSFVLRPSSPSPSRAPQQPLQRPQQ